MLLTLAAVLSLQAAPVAQARVHQYAGVAISPNAQKVVSTESQDGGAGKPARPVVLVRSAVDGKVQATFDPCGTCSYSGAVFSPDSSALAFMASDGAGTATLYVTDGATARVVTTVKGVAQTPRWSPDGKMLAILATPGARKLTGATAAGIPQVGEIGVVDDEQRIGVVSVAGGVVRYVSPSDTFVYEYDWATDGQGFVATAAKGNGDNNWWIAKVERFGLDASERVLASPKFQVNMPRMSTDGRSVAFIGGLMSDFGPVGGDLYTVSANGGEPKDITPGFKGTFNGFTFRNGVIKATAVIGDKFAFVDVDPATGKTSITNAAPVTMSAADGKASFSADGRTAVAVIQDFEHAPLIGVHGPEGGRILTHDNDAIAPKVKAQSITWKNDGFDVQGWLVGPLQTTPGKTYPMVTLVHGGPSSSTTPTYVSRGTVYDLVSRGYYVFQPNPRGSYGQGEAFVRANVRDLGGGDLGDILKGVDAAEKVAPIDDKRLGVFGHSYGGFMTMWSVTHTNRFKAAVAGAGISNWSSYYGQNGIAEWMPPFFGDTFYNDPAIYDKLSPIRYIKAAKTPTFIYVGERDVECPAPQSLEFYAGLKAMKVPSSLVIYEGEGHGIRSPEHNKDLTDRTVGWFDKYLAPGM